MVAACGGGGGGSSSTPPPSSPAVSGVAVTPNPAPTVTIGTAQQFSAAVSGAAVTDNTVTWSVTPPTGSTLSAGTIDKTGLYTTPYPAPATVTVTATSNQDKTVSGSLTVTLSAPAVAAGPALTVDVANPTHPINPYIYGMNAYQLTATTGKAANIAIDRWGGDATSRYNYTLDVTSSASDWYFENQDGLAGGSQSNSSFNAQVTADQSISARTIGTLPVNGWVAKDGASCSFPTATYPVQVSTDASRGCGNGVYPQGTQGCTNASGCNITGNDPSVTSTKIDVASWATNWVTFLVGKFGTAATGGVAVYDLDNEPTWWDAVHRDVHPVAFTYDEVTNNGIAVAKAVKAVDPTAEVSGPVIDFWWAYFYSKKDIESGWGSGPCYQPWQNPADRNAHGGVPLIEYYLQQFKAYDDANHVRLLDYVDLHTYFTPQYPLNSNNSINLTTAGNTAEQQLRLNSTRVFWDPTYTDPDTTNQPFPQPNYTTDANYTASCNTPAQAPQVIPMMKKLGGQRLSRHQTCDYRIQLGRPGEHQRRGGTGRHSRHLWTRGVGYRYLVGTAGPGNAGPGPDGLRSVSQLRRKEFDVRGHGDLLGERRPGQAVGLRRAAYQGQHGDAGGYQQDLRRPYCDDFREQPAGNHHVGAGLSLQQREPGGHCGAAERDGYAACGQRRSEHPQFHIPGALHHHPGDAQLENRNNRPAGLFHERPVRLLTKSISRVSRTARG